MKIMKKIICCTFLLTILIPNISLFSITDTAEEPNPICDQLPIQK